MLQRNPPQLRSLRILNLPQTVINLALDPLQLLPLAHNRIHLLAELFFDVVHIAVLQKIGNLLQRHIQRAQISNGIEHLELPRGIIAIACLGISILGFEQPQLLVMADAADAQMKKPRHLPDLKQLWRTHPLPSLQAFLFAAHQRGVGDYTDDDG